jgi:pSer/pThr/pTyr-binding forkhead associated (FHA) protein
MTGAGSGNDKTKVRKETQPMKKIPEKFQASVVIIIGHAPGMEYLITKEYTVLGRDTEADIALKDPHISRQHAAIEYHDGSYILKDLESTNGTRMSGKLIKQASLRHEDKFSLGDTTLQFVLEETGKSQTYEIG